MDAKSEVPLQVYYHRMMGVPELRGQGLRSDCDLVRFGRPGRSELSLKQGAAELDQASRASVTHRFG